MDRLTDKRLCNGNAWTARNWEELKEIQKIAHNTDPQEIYMRLAQYEDTGFTPEEIKTMANILSEKDA